MVWDVCLSTWFPDSKDSLSSYFKIRLRDKIKKCVFNQEKKNIINIVTKSCFVYNFCRYGRNKILTYTVYTFFHLFPYTLCVIDKGYQRNFFEIFNYIYWVLKNTSSFINLFAVKILVFNYILINLYVRVPTSSFFSILIKFQDFGIRFTTKNQNGWNP